MYPSPWLPKILPGAKNKCLLYNISSINCSELIKASSIFAQIIKPEVLFFDEPTSNLDPEFKNKIEELILSASKRTKVIIVSQDQVMARKIADELLFLDRGTLRSEY